MDYGATREVIFPRDRFYFFQNWVRVKHVNKLFLIKATKAKVIKINHAFHKPKPALNAPLNHRLIANEISL